MVNCITRRQQVLKDINEIGKLVIGSNAKSVDQEKQFPHISMAALREKELQTLAIPVRFGGMGAGLQEDILLLPLALMKIANWCSSTSQVFALHQSAVQHIKIYGDENQKKFFFEEIKKGHYFGSFGAEGRIKSTLRRVDKGYILNGEKIFTTGSLGATWAIWRVSSQDDIENRTYLPIINLHAKGITVLDTWDGIGQRGTGSGKVVAKNVFISEEHVMMVEEEKATTILFASMFHINFSAQFIGIAQAALKEAIRYIQEIPLKKESDLVRLRIGELSAKTKAAEQLMLYAARQLQAFEDGQVTVESLQLSAAQTKIISTDTVLDVTNTIFQVMGARSATTAYNFDRFYRNARTLTLHDEVDRQRIIAGTLEIKTYGLEDIR